jgi:hypothetical protein
MAIDQNYGVVSLRQNIADRIGKICPVVKNIVDGIKRS